MRIVFFSIVTPYKENRGGPSGHPYHLLAARPKDTEVIIYSFNNNHLTAEEIAMVEKELKLEIHLLDFQRWIRSVLSPWLKFVRIFLKYPIYNYARITDATISEVQTLKPDALWFYGQELSKIIRQLPGYKTVFTIADCYTFHFYRRLSLNLTVGNTLEFIKVMLNYRKYYKMEQDYPCENVTFHTVGMEDKRFLNRINPNLEVRFIRHPHYEIASPAKVVKFGEPRIKLLIAGRYDLYSWQAGDELVEALCSTDSDVRDSFEITILGKGWESHYNRLLEHGWKAELISFAPDYIKEITRHDIQINPLSLGTGTKGKVLDGLANGLLLIGTRYALENIAVKDGESCIEYDDASEVVAVLKDIIEHRGKYEQMAEAGRDAVLLEHSKSKVAAEFFELFLK